MQRFPGECLQAASRTAKTGCAVSAILASSGHIMTCTDKLVGFVIEKIGTIGALSIQPIIDLC